ncbi:MAG: phospholipase D-like domain-containing protein [Puniceicoccales bacterium]|jgi:cardiolipin synthase|nr:phospholipase D-like domain-containing protein [Puniceicoccales bacterium]
MFLSWAQFVFDEIVWPRWQSVLGLVLAAAAVSVMVRERRGRSNIMAWMFFILFLPVLGALCFLLFGGRKHLRSVALKRAINSVAGVITTGQREGVAEGGNSFELLGDEGGMAAWEALCAEIESARESIHITTYILGCDRVGRELVRRLAARARAGVRVRLLVDAVGSWGARLRVCGPLVAAGGEVLRFMPVVTLTGRRGGANFRNHRKMAVFDGQRAVVGGQNLGARYMGPAVSKGRYRDFSVRVCGPVVAGLTRIFLSDWCFASGESPERYREQLRFSPGAAGAVRMEVVGSGPDVPGDPLWERFVGLIQECRGGITLVTPYLVPDEVLFRVLLAKVRAGKRVRLIVPRRSDHPFLDLARRPYLRALHGAGAEVLLYDGDEGEGMLHGKLFLVDKGVGVVGSANLDMRSLFVNFEVALVIHSPNVVRRLRVLEAELVANCVPYAGSGLEVSNWRNGVLEALAHVVGPLL